MNTMKRLEAVAPGYRGFKARLNEQNLALAIEQNRSAVRRVKKVTLTVACITMFFIGSAALMSF